MKYYTILFLWVLCSLHTIASDEIEVSFSKEPTHFFVDINSEYKIALESNLTLLEKIEKIQQNIRDLVDADKRAKLILLAEGFDASLVTIAQNNMHPYYRSHIQALVLKEAPSDIYRLCGKSVAIKPSFCEVIAKFEQTQEGKASHTELFKSLSPYYQIDWFTPEVVLIDSNKTRRARWIESFNINSIAYLETEEYHPKIKLWYRVEHSKKVQPKSALKRPSYNGALLRYHLGKIAYKPRHKSIKKEIFYGKSPLQSYDVFYQSKSKKNPLFIYVHGGGWRSGDKKAFSDLCKQYADRGFTAVNINYRLMNLPKIGMKQIVQDVKSALEHILKNQKKLPIDTNKVVLMAESSGAHVAFLAMSKLKKPFKIDGAILNSMCSSLALYSSKKQIRLSGLKNKKKRKVWLDEYSPLYVKNLKPYNVPTLAIHSLEDSVVIPKHLELIDIQSVIWFDTITSLWIDNGVHPIAPSSTPLQPSYTTMQEKIDRFIQQVFKSSK